MAACSSSSSLPIHDVGGIRQGRPRGDGEGDTMKIGISLALEKRNEHWNFLMCGEIGQDTSGPANSKRTLWDGAPIPRAHSPRRGCSTKVRHCVRMPPKSNSRGTRNGEGPHGAIACPGGLGTRALANVVLGLGRAVKDAWVASGGSAPIRKPLKRALRENYASLRLNF
jgi:hypothetical protein